MNTLVDGVTYLVADEESDATGLYHGDTRHLLPVSASVADEELTLVDDALRRPTQRRRRYTNAGAPVNEIAETVTSKHATVVLTRRQTVAEGRYVDAFELTNHRSSERTVELSLEFGADFADIFEVRGLRDRQDRDVTADVGPSSVTYGYEHPDGTGESVAVSTAVRFDPAPSSLSPGRATFTPTLAPQGTATVTVEVVPGGDESTVRAVPDGSAVRPVPDGSTLGGGTEPSTAGTDSDDHGRVDPFVVDGPIETGRPAYDAAFAQARRDLRALTTRTDQGPVPLAGAPWFVTVFGRDALLASYLSLPVAPSLAAGTLRYLAAHQGRDGDDDRDEAPGKILHEVRRGELARTRAIPQTPYYGSIDATPLWVTLLHETWRWTGDDDLVSDLWPNLEAALDQLERAVAAVGENPFLYYRTTGSGGVVHKVWRDSANGVQYADGRRAEPPLASAAVQGYLHDALDRAADLARAVRGDEERAAELADRADALATAFDEAFWLPERRFYAAALTDDERRVDAVTSTTGHCLWAGVVPEERAATVAERLLEPDLSSGWGLRTLGADDAGYSPVSYHAGGVWPHDNALAALGLARYGHDEAAAAVATDQLEAFAALDGRSLPELFCGFDDDSPPVSYPAACRPQAWAAAAPFGLLRALFDLEPGADAPADAPAGAPATGAAESCGVASTAVEPILDHWGGA